MPLTFEIALHQDSLDLVEAEEGSEPIDTGFPANVFLLNRRVEE